MSVSDLGWADVDGSGVVGEGVVVHQDWGGVDQRGGDVVDQGAGHHLGLNSGGSLNHGLDHWGVWDSEGWGSVEDWGGDGAQGSSNWGWDGVEWESCGDGVEGKGSWDGVDDWGSNWSLNSLDDWGSLDNWGGLDKRSNWGNLGDNLDNWGRDSWGNWVNETILVDVLGESLKGNGGQTTWGLDSISTKDWGQRSSNWSIVDIRCGSGGEEKLGISFSLGFSLVQAVDSLVTSWGVGGVSRGSVGAVEVGGGVGVPVVGVSVGSVVVQRIGFRLSQTK